MTRVAGRDQVSSRGAPYNHDNGRGARPRSVPAHAPVNVYIRDRSAAFVSSSTCLGFRSRSTHAWNRVSGWWRLRRLTDRPADPIQPPPHSLQSKLIGRATQVVFVTENLAATYREWRGLGDHPWVRHEGVCKGVASLSLPRPSHAFTIDHHVTKKLIHCWRCSLRTHPRDATRERRDRCPQPCRASVLCCLTPEMAMSIVDEPCGASAFRRLAVPGP